MPSAPQESPLLELRSVHMTYKGSTAPVEALRGLDLAVMPGESVVILGPSGCGKSTALLLAAGLLKPVFGSVMVGGAQLERPRTATALILQDYGLLPWKTAEENAALGLKIRRLPRNDRRQIARQALAQVGLGEFAQSYPSELSGGMRQRLALARALALDVDLLLMDEPLGALDTLLRESLQDVLVELWRKRGYAQLLVTHSIEEAVCLGQRIAVMSARPGRIVAMIDNPQAGDLGFRATPLFHERCSRLRQLLAADGAGETDEAAAEAGREAAADAAAADAAAAEAGRAAAAGKAAGTAAKAGRDA
jgi:NitT/TauT family transport system ATP-binding protein